MPPAPIRRTRRYRPAITWPAVPTQLLCDSCTDSTSAWAGQRMYSSQPLSVIPPVSGAPTRYVNFPGLSLDGCN